ncbi:hypothetical protein [Candidatus Phytoplasma solani]|uniref:hypothetical protein n=1 Tax=Candidatus Phytoplasma solani TaxID=69896 RepID=UPI0032DBB237
MNNNKGNHQNNQYQLANRSNKPIIIGIIVLVIVFISAVVWFNFKKSDNLDNLTLNKDNLDNLTMNKIDEKIKSLNELDEEMATFHKEHEDQINTPEMVQLIAKLDELQTHFQGIQKPDGIYFSEFQRNKIKKMNFYEKEIEELKKSFKNLKDVQNPLTIKPKIGNDKKSKFKTTQSRFDQVKTYILSETDDKTLLPNNLPQEEKIEIEKIRKHLVQNLASKKRRQEQNQTLNDLLAEIDDYNRQIQEINSQFPSLNFQKTNLETKETEKNDKINSLKEKQQQFKYLPNQPESVRTTRQNNYNHLKAEISKLQDERLEIVKQIRQVEIKIGKLEIKQKSYESTLSNAIKLRDHLQRDYDSSKERSKNDTISQLNSLYEIIPPAEE